MKKMGLILGLILIARCGASEPTLIDSRQVRITTNDFPAMTSVGCTNLQQFAEWISHTITNEIGLSCQSGSCTNDQTNVFARVFPATPKVVGTWASIQSNSVFYVKTATPSNCIFGTTIATNTAINWIAK